MSESTAHSSVVQQAEPPLSFYERLIDIYFEPSKALADVNGKPSWLGIFLIMGLLSMASAYVFRTRVDQEALIRKAVESGVIKMTETQINEAIARQQTPLVKYGGLMVAPSGIFITYLVLAGIFLLVFMLMGVSLNYNKAIAVTFWGLSPPAIIQSILTIVVLYLKDPDTIDPMGGVLMSNPGALVASKAHPMLASIAGSLDIFSFWAMALLALGFASVSNRKLTIKRSAMGVVALWGLYVLGKALLKGGIGSLVSWQN
jgi:hypothetical protein